MSRDDGPRPWVWIVARLALAVVAAPAACCLFLAVLPAPPPSPEGSHASLGGTGTAAAPAESERARSSRPAGNSAPGRRSVGPPQTAAEWKSEVSRTIEPANFLSSVDEPPRPIASTQRSEAWKTLDGEAGGLWPGAFPESSNDLGVRWSRPAEPLAHGYDARYRTAGREAQSVAGAPLNPLRQVGDEAPAIIAPVPGPTLKIPLATSVPADAVQVDPQNGLITIAIRDAPLDEILGVLAEREGLNLICAEDVTANVSITVRDVPFEEALTHILSVAGYTCRRQGNFLLITSVSEGGKVSPQAQGREIRVFGLSYVSAADVDLIIKGLLSPVGQSFVGESDPQDHRKTREVLIVEDLPPYLARIEQTVEQLDTCPRQVLIEAHVLSVELEDDLRHGINWGYLKKSNPEIRLETTTFASLTSPQTMVFDLAASEMTGLVEWLKATTDAKTLASPKVFALNGQEARIQIGEQLGYRVTTTTQTSTLESVDFLDVGVILTVTPQITPDDRVLMKVKPVVSTGQISPETELPEEETTEVETSVMLRSGHGMIIGGLIQEEDIDNQQKVPWLGDMWLVGWLFQKRNLDRKRSEIVIALVPHIVPYGPECLEREKQQFYRATTPLLQGPLEKYPRPWEPTLPSAEDRPAWARGRFPCLPGGASTCCPSGRGTTHYSNVPMAPPAFYDEGPCEVEVQDGEAAMETLVPPMP